ncbi:tRNA pseudouridine(55) synthase TruB [Candidatus Saccharibacteria bacterium oral taxon 488]|nr:tRNA pseudouridine(55) synthase TruB [Candidatus Saccharibacteria bacterium oral taxon 488]QJU09738.1 tRNA pseudouridine(55) synthase TruB [Candidatus Saccharibacteria bacterium oral taxon 488]
MDEVLLIDKPAGMTSFGVVARLRRVLSQAAGKKVKVGHTGTLDPFATGLMIIVTGKKCREADTFTKLDKWYEAEIMLGETSTTGDPEGELTRVSERQPPRSEVEAVLSTLVGEIKQRPPIFSAIKINGRRAYQLARQGQSVDMPERTVSIYALELVAYEYPRLVIRAHVSSGTYIRSLAVDIGQKLGTGAYCHQLRRQAIAEYDVAQAKPLADFGISS